MDNALTLRVLEDLAGDLRRLKAETATPPPPAPVLPRLVSVLTAFATALLAG